MPGGDEVPPLPGVDAPPPLFLKEMLNSFSWELLPPPQPASPRLSGANAFLMPGVGAAAGQF